MADTLENIALPSGVWYDLYTDPVLIAAGIVVGTRIVVDNLGTDYLQLHAGADSPGDAGGFTKVAPGSEAINEDGDLGAWVKTPAPSGGLVNVRLG